tara:strand:+ start:304 stop:891 length:588 start_codon:yes stop_codon:yes gene_type:complete
MSKKITKIQQENINTLVAFDTIEKNVMADLYATQSERFAADCEKIQKGAAVITARVAGLTGKVRDAELRKIGAGHIAGNRDAITAYAKFADPVIGKRICQKAKAGKLGKCASIRGAVASDHKDETPKASRKPKAGQGKKQVSFKAGAKPAKATTTQAQLEVLEAAAKEHGFDLYTFFEAWSAESNEPAQKLVANG